MRKYEGGFGVASTHQTQSIPKSRLHRRQLPCQTCRTPVHQGSQNAFAIVFGLRFGNSNFLEAREISPVAFQFNIETGKDDTVWKVLGSQPILMAQPSAAISGFKGIFSFQYPVYTIRSSTGRAYYRESTALNCCNGSTASSDLCSKVIPMRTRTLALAQMWI